MYVDAWRSSVLIKHDPLSFSPKFQVREMDVRLCSSEKWGEKNGGDEFFSAEAGKCEITKLSSTPGRNN